jgi:hypothetical protein
MHTLAKRIHNIAPNDVRITFEDGSGLILEMRSAEFFQEAFQAEAVDADGTAYRLVTDGDDDPLVAGRETGDGWTTAGTVVDVAPADP